MPSRPDMISKATATRRERKLQQILRDTEAAVATRDAAIAQRDRQISDASSRERDLRFRLHCVGLAFSGAAADLKVIADVLRAHGAEDAEARLRTIVNACLDRQRGIVDALEARDGVKVVAGDDREQGW